MINQNITLMEIDELSSSDDDGQIQKKLKTLDGNPINNPMQASFKTLDSTPIKTPPMKIETIPAKLMSTRRSKESFTFPVDIRAAANNIFNSATNNEVHMDANTYNEADKKEVYMDTNDSFFTETELPDRPTEIGHYYINTQQPSLNADTRTVTI